jgi:hypothetical protein
MYIYHNGYQVADNNFTVPWFSRPASGFRLGCRFNDEYEQHWVGRIDDFRLYDRAVTAGEIATIGSRGTGKYSVPMDTLANLKTGSTPERINFGDFAIMAQQWLVQSQWP